MLGDAGHRVLRVGDAKKMIRRSSSVRTVRSRMSAKTSRISCGSSGLLGKDFFYRKLTEYPDGQPLYVSTDHDPGETDAVASARARACTT